MEGYGVYRWRNGDLYEGEFHNGLKHGKGTYTQIQGSSYEGLWANGKRNGKGILRIPGLQDPIEWEWKNDLPVKIK